MYILYEDPESKLLKIAEVPQGKTGEQFAASIGAIHMSDHATQEEAEQAKLKEENPAESPLEKGGKFSA